MEGYKRNKQCTSNNKSTTEANTSDELVDLALIKAVRYERADDFKGRILQIASTCVMDEARHGSGTVVHIRQFSDVVSSNEFIDAEDAAGTLR
ncbi:hypothetical protein SARC_14686, partial [Sphaeroforma arctica JP610]